MPKRSHGCFECRKRKVRCDETKPECTTCLRRGTKCPGYRPTQSFIQHTFDQRSDRPAIIREDEERYKYANQREKDKQERRASMLQIRAAMHSRDCPLDAPAPTPAPQQLPVSQAAIDRVQFLSSFLALYLPHRQGEILTPPAAMMLYLPNVPIQNPVFSSALDAVSMAQLAVDNKNYPMIYRTRSSYGTALSQLMRSIQHPKESLEDDTLLAAYMLALYEVFVGVTGGNGFFYHVQGLLHLLRLRGPASIKTQVTLDMFHGVRYNSLSIGYRMRRASMLDSPDWLSVTADAAKKDPYVALIDIAIGIPRILERTDKLARSGASVAEFETLIADSQALADKLFAWYADFQTRFGPLFNLVPSTSMEGYKHFGPPSPSMTPSGPPNASAPAQPVPAPESSTVPQTSVPQPGPSTAAAAPPPPAPPRLDAFTYDPVYHFRTFATYTTCINFWMALLILRSNHFTLTRHPSLPRLEPKQLFLWDKELSSYAEHICRGVPYGCRPSAGYSGRFGTLTPLIVAKKYFDGKMEVARGMAAARGETVGGTLGSGELPGLRESRWCERVYYGTQVPGLYSPPTMEPVPGVAKLRQNSSRYL